MFIFRTLIHYIVNEPKFTVRLHRQLIRNLMIKRAIFSKQ